MADRTTRPAPGMIIRAWVDTTDGYHIRAAMRILAVSKLGCGCRRMCCIRPGPRTEPPMYADVQLLTGDCDRHDQSDVDILGHDIVCGGRAVTDTGAHTGETCGATYVSRPYETAEAQARAAGWGILRLPDRSITATCPRCRRPDPATVAACRDLQTTIHRGDTTA